MDDLKNLEEYVEDFEREMGNIKQLSGLIKELKSYSEYLQTLRTILNNISSSIEKNMNNTEFVESIEQLKNIITQEGNSLKDSISESFFDKIETLSTKMSNLEDNNNDINTKLKLLDSLKEDLKESIHLSEKAKMDLASKMTSLISKQNEKINNIQEKLQVLDILKADIHENIELFKKVQSNVEENINHKLKDILLRTEDLYESDKTIQEKLKSLNLIEKIIKENYDMTSQKQFDLEKKTLELSEKKDIIFETKTTELKNSMSSVNKIVDTLKIDINKAIDENIKNHNINRTIYILGFIIIIMLIFFT